jgi:hypothetical protein
MERRRIIKIVGMAYLFAMSTDSALDLVRKPDRLRLGIELPLSLTQASITSPSIYGSRRDRSRRS